MGSSRTTRPVGVTISRCTSPPGVVTRARMGRPLLRACAAARLHDLPLRVVAGHRGGDAADGDGRRVGQARQHHRPPRGGRVQFAALVGVGFTGQLQYRYIERVVIGAGQRHDVHGDTDGGGLQDVRGAVDDAEVDRDMPWEADDVAGPALVPRRRRAPGSRCAPEFPPGEPNPPWTST